MCSPANKKELFNLCHASARNVIERIFGVLKRRFRILLMAPEYKLDVQARIPAALCAIHNFIRECDPSEGELPGANISFAYGGNNQNVGIFDNTDDESDTRRDRIAEEMWKDYQKLLEERGLFDETDSEEEYPDSEEELYKDDDDEDN